MERGRERGKRVSPATEKGSFIKISTMLGKQRRNKASHYIHSKKGKEIKWLAMKIRL